MLSGNPKQRRNLHDPTLTGDASIATWLEDPIGDPILRDMLAQAGQTPT